MGVATDAVKATVASVVARRVAAAVLAVSAAGVTTLVNHEEQVNTVYLDPVKIPTVCVGHTRTVSKDMVGQRFTDEQCEALLREDLQVAERAVKRNVTVPITQEQYDSLVSFTFNVGATNFQNSTLLKKLNAGDCTGAVKEFGRWIYAKGVKLRGLVNRRADESRVFATGCQA
jgi:lysozyme